MTLTATFTPLAVNPPVVTLVGIAIVPDHVTDPRCRLVLWITLCPKVFVEDRFTFSLEIIIPAAAGSTVVCRCS